MGLIKYTKEMLDSMVKDYQDGIDVRAIAEELGVPERSVIAKLSSLGIYQKKEYRNKRGETPVKKEEYINRISKLLDINVDLLESLEKVTKSALVLIESKIQTLKNSD